MWFPGTYSFSRMMVHNHTHLEWQQVMALTGEVVDSMMLIQTRHGPFGTIEDFPAPPPLEWDGGEVILWEGCILGAVLLFLIFFGGIVLFIFRNYRRRTPSQHKLLEQLYEI